MTTTPEAVPLNATSRQRNPAFPPEWLNCASRPAPVTLTPSPYSSITGWSIRAAISRGRSGRVDVPAAACCSAMAKRARSSGVVHSPAAACSG